MSDSFADLWSTVVPSSTAPQKPQKLNELISSTTPAQPARPQTDLFALLAASNPSSNSNSRTSSPGAANQPNPKSNSPKLPPPSSGDAFSALLSDSFGNGAAGSGNLSMAERAAKAEKERRDKLSNSSKPVATNVQSSAWVGLDSLVATPPFTSPQKQATQQKQADFDWLFDAPAPTTSDPAPPSSSTRTPPVITDDDEDWGLSDFASNPSSAAAPSPPQEQVTKSPSIWDFENVGRSNKPPSPPKRVGRSNSPEEDFDFGDGEDRLLDSGSNDEDDVLGSLSKPTHSAPPRRPPVSTRESSSKAHRDSAPPHIVGQLVEMGFGPTEARNALAATDTGTNVEAALEFLLAERESSGPSRPSPPPPERRRNPPRPQGLPDNELRPPVRRRPTDPLTARDKPPNEGPSNIQDQADKLLAQASEIGLNVFNKANAFWSQGKEKVQKVYEERVNTTQPATQKQGGRPRWMQEPTDNGNAHEPGFAGTGFKDSDDEEEYRPPLNRPAEMKRQTSKGPSPQPPRHQVKTGDLLAEEPILVYRSPFRHGSSSRAQTPQQAQSSSKQSPQRIPSPIPVTHRQTVPASATAIATCMKYKAAGTDMFKLGRYSEADAAYTSAISSLPESHLLQVQLYNNRGLSRLKTGEHSGTIEDCSFVISLIGPSYHPQREAKVTKEDEGSGVDLADGLMKGYKRRAEAYEGREKWEEARKDWEVIAGTQWANGKMRNEAISGVGRCRKMLNPQTDRVTSKPKPAVRRPPPKAVIRVLTPPSEALAKLRAATDAAEVEDQTRHELKDAVDAKIIAWKGGKEQNIRALIASLENVLWPELNWQKVGMHELVAPNQVKIRYTKAIAKLHPDKLNSNNTTVEQRMIANAVFGALNEAWNTFKP